MEYVTISTDIDLSVSIIRYNEHLGNLPNDRTNIGYITTMKRFSVSIKPLSRSGITGLYHSNVVYGRPQGAYGRLSVVYELSYCSSVQGLQ